MKVAISVPDPLFEAADALAAKLKKSRSQLYSEAVAAYLGAQGAEAVRRQLDAVCARVDSSPDPVMARLQAGNPGADEAW
jgi:metal-responsive CopG/Arc/MetJ family transcriptional regulator